MPAKKKTETEVTEEKKTEEYTIPFMDYVVVPIAEVPDYVLRGYTLVGGAVSRMSGYWHQALILSTTKTVEKEEYDEFAKKYMR